MKCSKYIVVKKMVNSACNPLTYGRRVQIDVFCYNFLNKKNAQNTGFEHFDTVCYCTMAERKGFEPSIELPLYQLSRRALSTTQAPL